ncbi:DUF2511 domain-containing protein [Kitasatospora sp. CB02891]|uniref:DUF2511 domain-containing protein n=1 Tax=Kitasatospora sp. CB02891 TaxID=2020329 RepID=UPI000C27E0AF|nr:DUF2511 domain-containing protein [Kitasatospora sp. CB02891]PJN24048.1 hypothetical protein CG736_19320 [Kitasatospora sp. CB02891]
MAEKQMPVPRVYVIAFGAVGAAVLLGWVVAASRDQPEAWTPPVAPQRMVSRADVTPWPFTVDSGTLRCWTHSGVTFQPSGSTTEYGLNGSARTMGYSGPEAIWAVDPALPGSGLRLDLGGAIAIGNALC